MAEFEIRPLIETIEMQEHATSLDDHVIACAAELFLRNGLSNVKMVEIARAANVGVATVYRHFSTKARIAVMAATLLWRSFNLQMRALVESEAFLALDGLGRLGSLLEGYCDAYVAHGDFVAFIDEFDRMALSHQVDKSDLAAYGSELDSFYPIFEDAYLLGRRDGSIVRKVEFRPFYLALAHALIGVAEKLCRGEIIPSDDFSSRADELRCIASMAMWSLASDAPVLGSFVATYGEG